MVPIEDNDSHMYPSFLEQLKASDGGEACYVSPEYLKERRADKRARELMEESHYVDIRMTALSAEEKQMHDQETERGLEGLQEEAELRQMAADRAMYAVMWHPMPSQSRVDLEKRVADQIYMAVLADRKDR